MVKSHNELPTETVGSEYDACIFQTLISIFFQNICFFRRLLGFKFNWVAISLS